MASHQNTHTRRSRTHDNGAELAHKANEALRETLGEFKERSNDLKATVKEYVDQKPFKALGIALLSGMALALLLKR